MKYYGIADISATLTILIMLYYIYGRRHKPTVSDKYFTKPPDDMPPCEVNAFIHKNKADSAAMASSILKLGAEGYVKFETAILKGKFLSKKKADIKILPQKNYDGLNDSDALLMDFLKSAADSGYDIKDYCIHNADDCIHFKNEYKKLIRHSIKSNYREYYEKPHKEAVSILLVISSINVLWAVLSIMNKKFGALFYSIPCFLISLCGIPLIEKMSVKGVNSLYLWGAFKNYLKNIHSMGEYDVPGISVLETYIPYTVALGVWKPVLKQIPSMVYDEEKEKYYSKWLDYCGYLHDKCSPIEDYDKIYEFIHGLCNYCSMIFNSKDSSKSTCDNNAEASQLSSKDDNSMYIK